MDAWAARPVTHLGLMTHGFPDLFLVTGPGSPSVLGNVVGHIEQHVEYIAGLLSDGRERALGHIEAVPGRPRLFMPYVGGIGAYRRTCDEVAADGYRGFYRRPNGAPTPEAETPGDHTHR